MKFFKTNLVLLIIAIAISGNLYAQDPIFENISVAESLTLIAENIDNPNFVILDVRSPGEHNPTHIEGAINRNFNDSDFSDQLLALNPNKTYLIHCASGGRSGQAFNTMQTMEFVEVFNMLGGMNAWNSASNPNTSEFAPLLMSATDSLFVIDTIDVGYIDTISVTITNRANDTLEFVSILDLIDTEYSTDFDIDTVLYGADDYTFTVYYEPVDDINDTLSFLMESNGGDVSLEIIRTGRLPLLPLISLTTDAILDFGIVEVEILDSLPVTINNSGEADMSFTEVTIPAELSEFDLVFDIDTVIPAGSDYTFYVYYLPVDEISDTLTIDVDSDGGTVSFQIIGVGEVVTNILSVITDNIILYPNPAKDFINIEGVDTYSSISVLDLNGRELLTIEDNNVERININDLNTGVYLLRLVVEGKLITKKFVVQ